MLEKKNLVNYVSNLIVELFDSFMKILEAFSS